MSNNAKIVAEDNKTIGKGLNFGASEAYKLLRANLAFSLPDNSKSKVIGVTSSLRGEGKSTTAINLAYTMAETGKKVLLIEGDMRLPVLSRRLGLNQTPGLSNLLAGQNSGNEVLQNSGLLNTLKVITSGAIPPNPAELLDSNQMETTLKVMREYFDVVIVDLPPVTAVSDALAVSRFIDGIIVVVRQDYCDKKALDQTVATLKFSEAKILGFVMTDSNQQQKSSKNKKGGYGANYGYTSKRPAKRRKTDDEAADL